MSYLHFVWRTLHGAGTLYRLVKNGLSPIEQAPEMNLHEDENLDEDMSDNELDCTGTIHRRYCRKFDREVAKELYWKNWDEVTEPGNYLKTYGGVHVPQPIIVVKYTNSTYERVPGGIKINSLDKAAAYLGPLPILPRCLIRDEGFSL